MCCFLLRPTKYNQLNVPLFEMKVKICKLYCIIFQSQNLNGVTRISVVHCLYNLQDAENFDSMYQDIPTVSFRDLDRR
jgi:hypothetical protein